MLEHRHGNNGHRCSPVIWQFWVERGAGLVSRPIAHPAPWGKRNNVPFPHGASQDFMAAGVSTWLTLCSWVVGQFWMGCPSVTNSYHLILYILNFAHWGLNPSWPPLQTYLRLGPTGNIEETCLGLWFKTRTNIPLTTGTGLFLLRH